MGAQVVDSIQCTGCGASLSFIFANSKQPRCSPLSFRLSAAAFAVNMNGNQDWDQVVIRKKAPTSAAAKNPSAVNAAIRAGGCCMCRSAIAVGAPESCAVCWLHAVKLQAAPLWNVNRIGIILR